MFRRGEYRLHSAERPRRLSLIHISDMKQSLLYFAKEVFGEQAVIRMRPSYFPFTEPSAEVDVSCNLCGGKGCPVCKGCLLYTSRCV